MRTPSGYHIVKLNEMRGNTQVIVNQVHARHILIKTNELQDDATVQQKLVAIRDRILNKGENFTAVASVVSEDPGSAAEGGDLGWAGPGTFVPEFEKQLAQLQPDEISQPFRTQFGWHIIQLLGRRQFDTTDDVRRQRPSRRCANPRPTKKPNCGCVACATRRTSSTSSERRAPSPSPSPRVSPPASARISASLSPASTLPCSPRRSSAAARCSPSARGCSASTCELRALSTRQPRRRACPAVCRCSTCRWPRPVSPAASIPPMRAHVLALLDRAIDGACNGEFAAMVTAPVQKSVINDAGVPFTGHTEYLAARTGAPHPVMLLAADNLRVALATTHLPLRAVSDAITAALLDTTLRILDDDVRAALGHRAAAHRGVRTQSACRRKRASRHRGPRRDRARHRTRARRRHAGRRPDARRHGVRAARTCLTTTWCWPCTTTRACPCSSTPASATR